MPSISGIRDFTDEFDQIIPEHRWRLNRDFTNPIG